MIVMTPTGPKPLRFEGNEALDANPASFPAHGSALQVRLPAST